MAIFSGFVNQSREAPSGIARRVSRARSCGHRFASGVWRAVHVAPPLVVTCDEINRMVTIADEALMIAEGEFAAEFAE